MKKIVFSLIFLGVISFIHAQRIAVVDIAAVLEGMSDYKTAQAEIDKVAAQWQQEIAQEYDKIKSMYNKYQAEQVLLSEDAKRTREDQIIKKEDEVRELQKRRFGPDGDLFKRRQQMVTPIQDKVFGSLQAYAGEKGFDIVLDKSSAAGILFVGPNFDKTDEVKKRLGSN
ncbi:MAG TPA: OmpH family outer membrane protein [Saprospiraceae bacterium]|nr:OmpH family outer membrane protein [Saprospiraceae bacterium]